MTSDLPPPTLVQDARGFSGLVDRLAAAHEIAVDTEADSFFSYREKVCLVQITVGEHDYLVDPLAGFDLRALGDVLADPSKRKVFHDGEYDILILKREYGFRFRNLFDTRVAAATLGSTRPGLAAVLQDHFGIELDKSMQRSNWGQRPLSDKQIRYARLDTHFLLPLMREQEERLHRTSRRMIVDGECRRLEGIEPPDTSFDPEEWVRIKGARVLDPLQRRVLRELYVLRDMLARAEDEPPFRVMNNDTLVLLAEAQPRHRAELARVRGFTSKQIARIGDQVLATIAAAREQGPLRRLPPPKPRDGTEDMGEETGELHERLKEWRKNAAAADFGIDSAYLLNRHVLLRIARERPRTAAEVARIEGIHEWQSARYAEALAEVVRRFERDVASGEWTPRRRRGPRGEPSGSAADET